MLAAQVHYRHTRIRFLQESNNLLLAKSLLHGLLLILRIGLYYVMKLMKGAGQRRYFFGRMTAWGLRL
jgi:hypothetical protein